MNNITIPKTIAGATDRPLVINGIEIDCYVLEDETRVLSQRGLFKSIGIPRGGHNSPRNEMEDDVAEMPRFAHQKWISRYISDELILVLKSPIKFQRSEGGRPTYGYPATVLVDICNAVIDADQQGSTTPRHKPIVERAMVLIRGLATVGIIALVDEATGYQEIRKRKSLQAILDKYLSKELSAWAKIFPDEFYELIFHLKGWPGPDGVKRPSVIGRYTNNIVYERLAPGVLTELRRRNPISESGRRKSTHHQWLTKDFGQPELQAHLVGVIALMRAAPNWNVFYGTMLPRAFPKVNEQIPLALDVI